VQHVEQLPLVFVDALDLHVEQRVRLNSTPHSALTSAARCSLLARLTARQSAWNSVFSRAASGFSLSSARDPPPSHRRSAADERAHAGVGMRHQRRG